MRRKEIHRYLSALLIAVLTIGMIPFTQRQQRVSAESAADSIFASIRDDYLGSIPDGEEMLSYSNNYQSMEPEQITFRSGSGTHSVNNGLSVTMGSLENRMCLPVWDKSPYLSSGIIDLTFQFYSDSNRIGFVFKNDETSAGIAVKYDVPNGAGTSATWVLQAYSDYSGDSSSYKTFSGPVLEQGTDYRLRIAFHQDRIAVALGDEIIFDDTVSFLDESLQQAKGQIGLFKWYGVPATLNIKEITIHGVGNAERTYINYEHDFEDDSFLNTWYQTAASKPLSAQIVTDNTGVNRVLQLTSVENRIVDLDAPAIENGTFSFDYKLVSGSAFSFLFRCADDLSSFNELTYDGSNWAAETLVGGTNKWTTDDLNLDPPVRGKWNNMMLNFEGDVLRIYLNKELLGEINGKDKIGLWKSGAGKLGFRLRNTTLQIDNLRYTDEILSPEEIVKYENDFSEGVTGQWTAGTASIEKEGNNRIMKLEGLNGESLNKDSVDLSNGTYFARIKPKTREIGVIAGDALVFYDGAWKVKTDQGTYSFESQIKAPSVNRWNEIMVGFTGGTIDLSVNGENTSMNLSAQGTAIKEGKLGLYAKDLIYVDDIIYTEEYLDLITAADGKLLYEEFYSTLVDPNYSGLEQIAVEDNYLKGSIPAGSVARNDDIDEVAHGIYQIKMNTGADHFGLQIGSLALDHKGNGAWGVSIAGGSESELQSDVLMTGEDVIIRAEIIENQLTLYINNQLAGSLPLPGYSCLGGFGIRNTGNSPLAVAVDAIRIEEIRVYTPDYTDAYTPNWEGKGTAVHDAQNGRLTVSPAAVDHMIDLDSDDIVDQIVSIGFTPNFTDSGSGGRYGFLLRYSGTGQYVSVECDVNGKWRVNASGGEYEFAKTLSLNKDESYVLDIQLVEKTLVFKITDSEKNTHQMGSVTVPDMTQKAGKFGIRSWNAAKSLDLDFLKVIEKPTQDNLTADVKTAFIEKNGLKVSLDDNFPRIISYEMNGSSILAQEDQCNTVQLNGAALTPVVTSDKTDASVMEYTLSFAEQDVVMKMRYSVEDNNVLKAEVTEIVENGEYRVRTFGLGDSAVASTHSRLDQATYAWARSDGEWHGITEELVDDMDTMERSESAPASMAMISNNGLALSVENNVMSGGSKIIVEKRRIRYVTNKASIHNGTWTYRHSGWDKTEQLPWFKVVVTEDRNNDGITDWQDAAVAYRKHIMTKAFGSEDIANSMMYIPFNFASQANDTFLNSLDTGKVLYNYTDGFGQMLLHKGYQAEGHDDDIPSYSNIGVRQGGVEDLKTLIELGAQYNLKVGVHINATEYHLDAGELYYDNLRGATAKGYQSDSLSGGWDWIDTSYYVNQTNDVLSGELEKRFTDLYELTKTENAAMDFYYIDVYTGNDYNAYKMVEYINQLGLKAGTEFAGPLEPGVTFVHWGTDLGYSNTGNRSSLYRMVKNDLDIFCANALYKGQKIPIVSYWGDSKMDIQQGVSVFFNEVIPTKYMQHFGVMKSQEHQITFEDGLVSQRTGNKTIELKKDGKLVAVWKDTGTTTADTERHNSETLQMIPWSWDQQGGEIGLDEGAKLYHWNPEGGQSTWELTGDFAGVSQYTMYELTQQGKVKVADYSVSSGSITVNAEKNTPYVLYPSNVDPEDFVPNAGDWGEGSEVLDFAFNAESVGENGDAWQATGNVTVETVAGRSGYNTSKETSENRWNKYAQIGTGKGSLVQDFDGLEPEQDYTLSVWANVTDGRKAVLEVEIDGETYSNYVTGIDGRHYSNFKYRNSTWQRLFVKFKVPAGVTGGTVRLIGEAGSGLVQFDDVKVWKHLFNEPDINHSQYVAYEDFENVSEGWGIFEYGSSGSLNTHLASYQDNPNNQNEIVSAGSGKQGPVMTWVLDGATTLKYAERSVGYSIKTSEAGLKLEPNTKYELSFIYTLEEHTGMKVLVKSRSTGAVVFQQDLVKTLNTGDMKTHSEFYAEFETGNESDYQVIFEQTRANTYLNSSGKTQLYRTQYYAFMLDNFGVAEHGSPREKLQKTVDSVGTLDEDDYTTESWGDLQTVLKKAEEALKQPDTLDDVFIALQEELSLAIKSLVKQVGRTELEKLIAKAGEITASDDYTGNSWNVFSAALNDATTALNGSSDEINTAYTNLERALHGLVSIAQLKTVIAQANDKNQENFTSASWNAFQNALSGAVEVRNNPAATAIEVSAAIDSLTQASGNLTEKGDVTALSGLIRDAEKLEQADYTEDSWREFHYALEMAKTAVGADDSSADELKSLYQNLEAAIGGLKQKDENIALDKLVELFERAELLNQNDYSEPYWSVFKQARDEAQQIILHSSDDQPAINRGYRMLELAMNLMIKAQSNSGKVMADIALELAEKAIGEGYDEKAFLTAYNRVKSLDGNAVHTDVVTAVFELLEQMQEIGFISGGILDLQDLLDISRQINTDYYENNDKMGQFKEALETAETLLKSQSPDIKAVKEAYGNLFSSVRALAMKKGTVVDKSILNDAIRLAEIKKASLGDYLLSGQEVFLKALSNAHSVAEHGDATQEDVNVALADLLEAMNALKRKADKSKLSGLISQAEKLDLSGYTAQSAATLKEALAKAKEIMADETLGFDQQDKVNAVTKQLQEALDGLVEQDAGGTLPGGSIKTGDVLPILAIFVVLVSGSIIAYVLVKKRKLK